MAKFQVTLSDPSDGSSRKIELEGARAQPFIGRRIGDVLDGALVGVSGRKLKITGGSDKDGVPMRPDVHGGVRASIILSGGVGFRPKEKGARRRKLVRGNIVTEDIVQLNLALIPEK